MTKLSTTTTTLEALKKLLVVGAAAALVSACGGTELDQTEAPAEVDEAAIFGSDACKNTDIEIDNNYTLSGSARRIKVLKIEYYSASEARWLTENLADTEIAAGSDEWFFNEDLQYAENDLITQFKIHFKYVEFDGDWSDTVVQTDNTPDVTCRAGTNFHLTVD